MADGTPIAPDECFALEALAEGQMPELRHFGYVEESVPLNRGSDVAAPATAK